MECYAVLKCTMQCYAKLYQCRRRQYVPHHHFVFMPAQSQSSRTAISLHLFGVSLAVTPRLKSEVDGAVELIASFFSAFFAFFTLSSIKVSSKHKVPLRLTGLYANICKTKYWRN